MESQASVLDTRGERTILLRSTLIRWFMRKEESVFMLISRCIFFCLGCRVLDWNLERGMKDVVLAGYQVLDVRRWDWGWSAVRIMRDIWVVGCWC